MRRTILGLALLATSLVGCGGGYGYYYANSEVIGVAPGPGYVWINGYWAWRGNSYTWVPGYYARPPRRGAVWVAPRWEHQGGRYRFHEGHWR